MSDTNDDNPNRPGGVRTPLSLKPRPGAAVSAGTVKQSFSHGRSKTVVVETKRRRIEGHPAGGQPLGGPSAAEKRATLDTRPREPAAPRTPGAPNLNLSAEELQARQRVVEAARVDQERRDGERSREAARRAEEEAKRREAEAARAPQPVAEAATPPPVVERAPEPVRAAAPAARAEPRPEAPAPRRDDRASTTTYRPDRPASPAYGRRVEGEARPDRGPREARPEGRTFGDRPPRTGETVRYSALAPRPAPARDGAAPRGPRPPGAGRPEPAPAGPEIQRATRQAPRPTGSLPDRRPDDDEEGQAGRNRAAGKATSRVKGAPQRREGRLTIQAVAGNDDEAVERMRSLASVRRARERERERRKGGGQEQAKIAREVVIPDVITVQELAGRMATRGVEIIKFLMRQGLMLKINDVIDSDTAELVATEFGHTVKRVSEADVEEGFIGAEDVDDHLVSRSPVVTVMGHVDHGKTSLLDALRSTDVVAGEHGGITQHIGAYQVRLEDGSKITFLDTPGHAAFSAMRARGAHVTDIVVLVVAADDGVMPQTIEAINHARAAEAPIIVAINKIDKPEADPNRVINELLQHEIVVERLGGDTQAIEVSATQKTGLDHLLEAIQLQAELMDLKANPDRSADGVVIEAKLDRGRGVVASVLVKRGTLKRGDIVVAGSSWGRVRALINERDEQVASAGPSEPVEILGLDDTPDPGEPFAVVEDEARARELTDYRIRQKREKTIAPAGAAPGASLADMMAKLQDSASPS